MKAEEGPWPFRPIHITNDGEYIKGSDRPDLYKLTEVGIISNDHLKGIETTMCANLQKPTTLIEFSPNGDAVRTDSPLLDTTSPPCGLLPTCELLRETRLECCYNCDIKHASLFEGLMIGELTTKVQQRIKDSNYIQEYRKRNLGIEIRLRKIKINKRQKRYFLEYDCPLLGYREVVFPIFFESRVVAVFFTGQICLARKKGDMSKIQDAFFKSGLAPREVKKKKNNIKEIHKNIVDMYLLKDDNGHNEYEELLEQICGEVERLEDTLKKEMSLQRERRVKEKIENQIKELQARFRKSKKKEDLSELWANVGKCMETLINDFHIRYVIIFGIERPMQQNRQLLGVVESKGDIPQELADRIKSKALKYDLDNIPEQLRGVPITSESIATDDLHVRCLYRNAMIGSIKNFPERFVRKKNLIRIFPLPFSEHGSVVILIGYYDDNPLNSGENRPSGEKRPSKKDRSEGYLDKNIGIFYQYVLSMLSSILAKAAQENITASLRVLGHEADQLNFGLEGMRRKYLRNAIALKHMKDKKLDDISRDIEGYFGQLNFLFKQATQAVSELPVPKKNPFWAYRDILFKWEDMYRLTVRLKNLKFDIFRTWKEDPQRPPVYGDKNLLEQLVYSLVSNAVKYCRKGTKIHLDCVKEYPDKAESPHILTVTNYGREFQCKSPFELGTRGKNVKGIEGLGIGLHNAKRIAEVHMGSLDLEQLPNDGKISDYNVPLIEPYIKTEFKGKDDLLAELLKKELENLKKSKKYYEIVADTLLHAPKRTELIKFIKEATWEIKFKVTIPAKRS